MTSVTLILMNRNCVGKSVKDSAYSIRKIKGHLH